MKYRVLEDDNFHYMDKDERIEVGTYDTAEEAVNVAKGSVDDFLKENFRPGMAAEDLYRCYTGFGPDPFIVSSDFSCKFHAWNYAKERCCEICNTTSDHRPLNNKGE